CMQGLEFPYNF
nr:immunoglobulin light chain junction region [Macaca mulatta]